MGRGSRADKVAQQARKTGFGVGHGSMAAQKYLVAMLSVTGGALSRLLISNNRLLKRRVHQLRGNRGTGTRGSTRGTADGGVGSRDQLADDRAAVM